MSMYKYTRQEAAEFLWVSTRSIDRYVKSWKIRAEKRWKIIYLNAQDLNNMNAWWTSFQEVIVEPKTTFKTAPIRPSEPKVINERWISVLDKVYEDLKEEIKEKDRLITELSIRVGQAEEMLKNSVSLIDYKKSQLLLEESRSNLNQAIIDLESEKEDLQKQVKHQKANNIIMLLALVALFAISWTIFLYNI